MVEIGDKVKVVRHDTAFLERVKDMVGIVREKRDNVHGAVMVDFPDYPEELVAMMPDEVEVVDGEDDPHMRWGTLPEILEHISEHIEKAQEKAEDQEDLEGLAKELASAHFELDQVLSQVMPQVLFRRIFGGDE